MNIDFEQVNYRAIYETELNTQITKVKNNGFSNSIRCPFPNHKGKENSFAVNVDSGEYRCHECNKSGDLFNYFKEMGYDLETTIKILSFIPGSNVSDSQLSTLPNSVPDSSKSEPTSESETLSSLPDDSSLSSNNEVSLNYRVIYEYELGTSLVAKRNGFSQSISCPFTDHKDKNPFFEVNIETGVYECQGCDRKGNLFDYYQKIHGLDYETAMARISSIPSSGCTESVNSSDNADDIDSNEADDTENSQQDESLPLHPDKESSSPLPDDFSPPPLQDPNEIPPSDLDSDTDSSPHFFDYSLSDLSKERPSSALDTKPKSEQELKVESPTSSPQQQSEDEVPFKDEELLSEGSDEISEAQKEIDKIIKENELNEKLEEETYGAKESEFSYVDVMRSLEANEEGDKYLFINLLDEKNCYDHAQKKWSKWGVHYWQETSQENMYYKVEKVVEAYQDGLAQAEKEKIAIEKDLLPAIKEWASKNDLQDEDCKTLSSAMDLIDQNEELFKNDNSKLKKKISKLKRLAKKISKDESKIQKRIFSLRGYSRKKNIVTLAKALGDSGLGITGKTEWQIPPGLLPCENGIVNIDNCEIRNGEPGDYINQCIPTKWDPHATCQRWEKFLSEILEGDQDMVDYMQRVFGYALSGTCKEHVFFILRGEKGGNGKSTMFEVIKDILGPLAQKIDPEMVMESSFTKASNSPSPEILALRGIRVGWMSEINHEKALDLASMKGKTGGDRLSGRALHSNHIIEFKPTHTLFMLTNPMPKIKGNDLASFRRFHIIEFNLSFVENPEKDFQRKGDVNLKETLQKEIPGILTWMVKGYQEYKRIGLKPPQKVLDHVKQYQRDEDIVGHFIEDKCVKGETLKAQANLLYSTYSNWCTINGHKSMSATRFGREMKKRFKDRRSNGIHYLGIGIKLSS